MGSADVWFCVAVKRLGAVHISSYTHCMHCAGDAEKERKYAEMSLEIRGRMAAAYFQYAEYAMKAFARSGDTVGALKFLEPMNSRQKAYLLRRTMSDLSRNPSGLDGIVEILKSL